MGYNPNHKDKEGMACVLETVLNYLHFKSVLQWQSESAKEGWENILEFRLIDSQNKWMEFNQLK